MEGKKERPKKKGTPATKKGGAMKKNPNRPVQHPPGKPAQKKEKGAVHTTFSKSPRDFSSRERGVWCKVLTLKRNWPNSHKPSLKKKKKEDCKEREKSRDL